MITGENEIKRIIPDFDSFRIDKIRWVFFDYIKKEDKKQVINFSCYCKNIRFVDIGRIERDGSVSILWKECRK
jgi:hypothetical protein